MNDGEEELGNKRLKFDENTINEMTDDFKNGVIYDIMCKKYKCSQTTILQRMQENDNYKSLLKERKNNRYQHMKDSYIKDRLHVTKLNNQGCEMTVIEYYSSDDIVVQFNDKLKTKRHCTWSCFERGEVKNENYRLYEENISIEGFKMRIVKYIKYSDIIVEFQDKYKSLVHTSYSRFLDGHVKNPRNGIKYEREGVKRYNKNGELMKCIEYINATKILVEFQDKYKKVVITSWKSFDTGSVKNPCAKTVFNVGITDNIRPTSVKINNITSSTKEYSTWHSMLNRSFSKITVTHYPAYQNVTCCEEWLYYPNFYDWLYSQENFEQWRNGERWALDKDILIKGNKIYSPKTCCLVPPHVNSLFTKCNVNRGSLPIGVYFDNNSKTYRASYIYGKEHNTSKITAYSYPTPEDAFYLGYKPTKEAYIKRIAQEEFNKGNITECCYDAMMNYEVEITD